MSTACTVDCGDRHHLYAAISEPYKVYLSLDGVDFLATPDGVTVAIPAEIWERIRIHGIEEFRASWMTDDPDEPPATPGA